MTKYEWESELKKNIHRLPADEIARVMEYYDELFADKIERGYNEYEIIGQFGNPVDVADKILSGYEGELADASASVPPPAAKRTDGQTEAQQAQTARAMSDEPPAALPERKADAPVSAPRRAVRGERAAIVILVLLFTGFAPLLIAATVWIVAAAVRVAGFACAAGGAAATLWSVVTVFRGAVGAGAAQAGMCLALCGVGILLATLCCKGWKYLGKGTAAVFRAVSRWVCPLVETEVKA